MIGAASVFAAELETKDHLLLPLGDLPESTRHDLVKKLSELAEDGDTLSLLEQTVRRILTRVWCVLLLRFNPHCHLHQLLQPGQLTLR